MEKSRKQKDDLEDKANKDCNKPQISIDNFGLRKIGQTVFKYGLKTEQRIKLHKQRKRKRWTQFDINKNFWDITSLQDIDLLEVICKANCQCLLVSFRYRIAQRHDLTQINKFNRSLAQINFSNLQRLQLSHSFQFSESLSMINAPLLESIRLFQCTISSFKSFAKINLKNLKNISIILGNVVHEYHHFSRARMSDNFCFQNFRDQQLKGQIKYNTFITLLKYSFSSLVNSMENILNLNKIRLSPERDNVQIHPINQTLKGRVDIILNKKMQKWISKEKI